MTDRIAAAIDDDLRFLAGLGVAVNPALVERFRDAPAEDLEGHVVSRGAGEDNVAVRRSALQVAIDRSGFTSGEAMEQWALLLDAARPLLEAQEARVRIRRAVDLIGLDGPPDAAIAAWISLAAASEELDPDEAARWYRKAIDAAQADRSFPDTTVEVALSAARFVAASGDVPWAQRAVAYARKLYADYGGSVQVGDALQSADVMVFSAAGRDDAAVHEAARVRKAVRHKQGPWARATVQASITEFRLLMVSGRPDEARRLVEGLLAEHGRDRSAPPAAGAALRFELAHLLMAMGEKDHATALMDRCLKLLTTHTDPWSAEVLEEARAFLRLAVARTRRGAEVERGDAE